MNTKKKISEEIIIVGSRYGELAVETKDLYVKNYRTEKDAFRRALGDDMVYMHPVTNQFDPYAVAVFNCDMKRIGYVWMYQAPAMRCWLDQNNQDYVRAFITEANPVAEVLMAETEQPFEMPVVPRTSQNVNLNWADNLPEVLTNPNESLSFGLSQLLDELKVATPWSERLQLRIDNLLDYIQVDFSAYRYQDFRTAFWMMRASESEKIRIQSDFLLNALINRASTEHMDWWTNKWLPYFFRKAADSDLLALFEAAHYSLDHVESLLDYAPENLYYKYKVSPLKFANKLYYSALPLKIYNRLLTLMAVREAMVNEVASPQTANKKTLDDGDCFKIGNDFVMEKVEAVVKKFYNGSHAELSLIELTLYDHNLLKKRNSHTAFLKKLMTWGILNLSDEELKKASRGMAFKMHSLPSFGYMEWDGSDYLNDKKTCTDIGRELGPTIAYNRKKEARVN